MKQRIRKTVSPVRRYALLTMIALAVLLSANQIVYSAILPVFFFRAGYDRDAEGQLQADPTVSELALKTQNGTLYGWRTDGNEERVILYFGGSGTDSNAWLYGLSPSFRTALAERAVLLTLDYPTFGKSSGVIGETAFYRAAEALYAHAKETYPNVDPILMGYSIGTAAAIRLASEHPTDGLILVAPLYDGTSIYTDSRGLLHAALELFASVRMQNDERAPLCPVRPLMIAGDADSRTPLSDAARLSNLFPSQPMLVTVIGCAHDAYWARQETYDAIIEYLDR